MTTENKKLKMVIYYVVRALELRLTKTKLMKLMFIIDYIAKNSRRLGIGRTITGSKYIYYHYGPYSRDVANAINDMNKYEIEEIDLGELSRYSSLYSYRVGNRPRFNIELEPKEKEIIDYVIQNYGYMPLEKLLFSIYNTSFMKKAKPLDVLLE